MTRTLTLALAVALLMPVAVNGRDFNAATQAQGRDDEARPRELQRLREDAQNLDGDLEALPPDAPESQEFRQRAEEIREEVIYLKVKMRRHRRAGGAGTGVSFDEVSDVRRLIGDLRDDVRRNLERETQVRELRLPEGTRVLVRLDEALSSSTAQREDRFEASVFRPVRVQGGLAIPAGTRVRGIVTAAEPAQRPAKGGRLELDFDTLYLGQRRLDWRSRVVALDQETDSGSTAGKAGIGAVLGGVLGGILGGKKGVLVGVIVGGTGAVVASKGDEVDLPAGTLVTVELTYPLVIEQESNRGRDW